MADETKIRKVCPICGTPLREDGTADRFAGQVLLGAQMGKVCDICTCARDDVMKRINEKGITDVKEIVEIAMGAAHFDNP